MLALAIFILTLTFVLWQPRRLGIGWSALGGASLIALATGVVQWADIGIVWHIVWDATFTFVALILISLILDEAGFFTWAALHVTRWGRGRGHVLLPLLVILGALISAIFANDGAALLLTPRRRGHPEAAADSQDRRAGLRLRHGVHRRHGQPAAGDLEPRQHRQRQLLRHLPFTHYAMVMIPVNLVSVVATLVVLRLAFARQSSRAATRWTIFPNPSQPSATRTSSAPLSRS
ncbi:Arsenical pump membrane protein OS=Castellaniella defragrans OX=75697 GN=HNR28_002803 PE=3 SV=1 [Castellaniella defragrans]